MANLTKDARIIKDNPDLTPYELLTEKGLSQNGYDHLVAHNESLKAAPAKQVIERPVPQIQTPQQLVEPTIKTISDTNENRRAIPAISEVVYNSGDMATLINNKTGKQTSMSKSAAVRFAKKYPKEYKVA